MASDDCNNIARHPDAPKTREECRGGLRPCPWLGCKYHLGIGRMSKYGMRLNTNVVDEDGVPWPDAQTCTLDLAEEDGITLDAVGTILGLTRERVRQIESSGIEKMRESWEKPPRECISCGRMIPLNGIVFCDDCRPAPIRAHTRKRSEENDEREEGKNYCQDCGTPIKAKAKRCTSCYKTYRCSNRLKEGRCQDCGTPISLESKRCQPCFHASRRKKRERSKLPKKKAKATEKRCPMCQQTFPRTGDHWYFERYGLGRISAYCRACSKAKVKAYTRNKRRERTTG